MNTKRWQLLKSILDGALNLPEQGRQDYVRAACKDDQQLFDEVWTYLEAKTSGEELNLGRVFRAAQDPLKPGDMLGPYRIEKELGEGGMGVVYLAMREDDVQFQVAIKVLKRGMDTRDILKRFNRERQILADLNHPYIARFLDSGATAEGLPYFVMSYVQGAPLETWCHVHNLNLQERINLFLKVCEAVSFAHQNLVIHRDLKSSNILVDENGEPRLLDFGIATLLEAETQNTLTAVDQRPMTLEYASPEQIRGERLNAASDVYSLGVILYKLLTGQSPYGLEKSPIQLRQAIFDKVPTKPSSVATASPLKGDPKKLKRTLHGDPDNIILKCLAKEPGDRYASVEALAEDLRRFLNGVPVRARRPTLGYVLSKFVSRNRVGLAVTAFVVSLTLVFIITTIRQQRITASERDTAERVSQFLIKMFETTSPEEAQGKEITLNEVLEKGASAMMTDLDDGRVKVRLSSTLGKVYRSRGMYGEARPLLETAVEGNREMLGDHPAVAEALNELAILNHYEGDYNQAKTLYEQALELAIKLNGRDDLLVARIKTDLGSLYYVLEDLDRAEALTSEALATKRRLGADDISVELNNLAAFMSKQGNHAAAIELHLEDIDLCLKQKGERHPDYIVKLNNIAAVYTRLRQFKKAEGYLKKSLELTRLVMGGDHMNQEVILYNLGRIYYDLEAYDQAIPTFRKSLEFRQNTSGRKHRESVKIMNQLAIALREQGSYEEAEQLFREIFDIQQELFGPDHWKMGESQCQYAALLIQQERKADLVPVLQEIERIFAANYEPTHWRFQVLRNIRGGHLRLIGEYPLAETQLLESYEVLKSGYRQKKASIRRLISLYQAWDKPEQLAHWQKQLARID